MACTPLPNHPKPSTADYSSANCAPIIELLAPLVGATIQTTVLRYENNTPCDPTDDIFVAHPVVTGVPYAGNPNPCDPNAKASKAIRVYEKYAKKSKRLEAYMKASPAKITYFNDHCWTFTG